MRKIFLSSMLACAAFGLNATVIGDLNYKLNEETLEATVTTTAGTAYSGDIVIPSTVESGGQTYTVKTIDTGAFMDSKATSIEIPNTVTIVSGNAFQGSSDLTTVKFGTGVTEVGGGSFTSCFNIDALYFYSTTPPAAKYATFNPGASRYGIKNIYVPAESVEAYKTASNWSFVADKIQAMPSEGPEAYTLPFEFKMDSKEQLDECGKPNCSAAWYFESIYVDFGKFFWYAGVGDGWLILPAVDFGEAKKVSVSINANNYDDEISNAFDIYLGRENTPEAMTLKVLSQEWPAGTATSDKMNVFTGDVAVEGGIYYPAIRIEKQASIWFNNFSIVEAQDTDPVGIESIEAEDGAVEYFNMQGMRVANPEKGQLVIVRKGNKAVKAVL